MPSMILIVATFALTGRPNETTTARITDTIGANAGSDRRLPPRESGLVQGEFLAHSNLVQVERQPDTDGS
ncbi:hypothetical protein [Streptomyces sp. NPDC002553]|uniref:hypothetical protein n=1 Tax=unclassified Streptomyces TaxID=2593676 RepID=UPI0033165C3D